MIWNMEAHLHASVRYVYRAYFSHVVDFGCYLFRGVRTPYLRPRYFTMEIHLAGAGKSARSPFLLLFCYSYVVVFFLCEANHVGRPIALR